MKKKLFALCLACTLILPACGTSANGSENYSESVANSTVKPTEAPEETSTPTPVNTTVGDSSSGFTATKTTHVDISDSGLQELSEKYTEAVASLTSAYDDLPKDISSFDELKANEDVIYGWFEYEKEVSSNLLEDTKSACDAYYNRIEAETTDAEVLYDKKDEINDVVYKTLLEYYKESVYDDLYEKMKETYYDAIYEDVRDTTSDYSSWFDSTSNFYSTWLDSASNLYSNWLDTCSDVYEQYLDKGSAYYSAYLNNVPYTGE